MSISFEEEHDRRRNRWREKRNGMKKDKYKKAWSKRYDEDEDCSNAEAIRRQMREEDL